MRTFSSVLFLASVASIASAQSTTSSESGSSSLSAELAAIPECNTTQLNEAQATLQSNAREAQCEEALSLESGTMLQVTTVQATQMCDTPSCTAALQQLYNELPNCRYELWGLQYSAEKLLEYCGTTPTNETESASLSSASASASAGWSVVKSSSNSFASAGATDAPSTASSTEAASSASTASSGSSAASATTAVSAVLATAAGLVAAFLA